VRVSKYREERGIFEREEGQNSIGRSVIICTLTKYYPCGQIKKVEIDWECSTNETDDILT